LFQSGFVTINEALYGKQLTFANATILVMVRTMLESVWFKYVKVVRPMIEISLVS